MTTIPLFSGLILTNDQEPDIFIDRIEVHDFGSTTLTTARLRLDYIKTGGRSWWHRLAVVFSENGAEVWLINGLNYDPTHPENRDMAERLGKELANLL